MISTFGFNKSCLTKDNEPWFPIMGEMHYSRYPKQYWKESLYKMKAGGVDVVSSYTIWIHHEEIEGVYDFSGNKDLRYFVQACKECGLYLMLRIGPWIHGEVRNGGFPDWLYSKNIAIRENDSAYFTEVRKFYTRIYHEIEGFLFKNGGPIIGIQIENEYGHCGGLTGADGEEHMRTLYQMACEIGYDVPFYTATGWGGAITGGLLPVMGGYCEAPWDQRITKIEPSGNYIFTYERNDHNIGSDYGFGTGITFDLDKFPYLTAELGGGLQVTHHRRPVVEAEDIGAMSLVKIGSGVNLLGYYMYHGGTNPRGKLTGLQETRDSGAPNDLPELNYDFRAPIREYGQISDTFKELKLLTMFIHDFGRELCDMPAYIPDENPLTPMNQKDLRTSVRHNGESGYIFINNYQRKYPMQEHRNIQLEVKLQNGNIVFPETDIYDKDYYFYPFHMKMGDTVLKTALATPLCRINHDTYAFYTDRNPHYLIEGDKSGIHMITLSKEDAKNSWKVKLDKEYLIITQADVIESEHGYRLLGRGPIQMKVYPYFTKVPEGFTRIGQEKEFTTYRKEINHAVVNTEACLLKTKDEIHTYEIKVDIEDGNYSDCFLQISYAGDQAKLYYEGMLIADHFYTGRVWEVGLKQFDFPNKLQLEIYPLKENAKIFLEEWPVMKQGVACELMKVTQEVEYSVNI